MRRRDIAGKAEGQNGSAPITRQKEKNSRRREIGVWTDKPKC